jgi:transposase
MPAPLSNDLRKRIIASKLSGDTEDTIAVEKEVGKSTVTKLWSLYRQTGSYEPRPNPCGRKPALSLEELELVRNAIVGRPDITLSELIDQFGFVLSISALSKIVRFKLGLHFKKNAIPQRTTMRRCQDETRRMEGRTAGNAYRQTCIS